MICRTTLAVALSLFALVPVARPADKPTDGEIEKLVIGKWRHDDVGGIFNATTTYAKDGTFVGEGTGGTGDDAPKIRVTGKWKVSDGAVIETIETCKPAIIPAGKQFTDTVLELTDRVFRYRTEEGKERTKTRISE
jgi:hypothetical protein